MSSYEGAPALLTHTPIVAHKIVCLFPSHSHTLTEIHFSSSNLLIGARVRPVPWRQWSKSASGVSMSDGDRTDDGKEKKMKKENGFQKSKSVL